MLTAFRWEYQAWMVNQFLHGEQGALVTTARLVETVPDMESKVYAASQVADEARHVEAYARYIDTKLGVTYPINPGLRALLRDLFDPVRPAPDWHPDGNALTLTNAAEDEITRCWNDAATRLLRLAEDEGAPDEAHDLAKTVAALGARRSAFYTRLAGTAPDPASVTAQEDAVEHCVHHAAASVVLTWLHGHRDGSRDESRDDRPAGRASGLGWVILSLQRLLGRLEPGTVLGEAHLPVFEQAMASTLNGTRYFSTAAFLPPTTG